MYALSFERTHKVLKIALLGVFTSEDVAAIDRAVVGFTSREGPSHGLIDFSLVQAIAVPLSKLASRAQQPPINPEWTRVFVAPRNDLIEWARRFADCQVMAGIRPPSVVHFTGEAHTILGLADPTFDPVETGS